MKNLKKLSREDLKTMVGGAGPFTETISADPVTCHMHYITSSSGEITYTYEGSGPCHNRNDGSQCKTYTAMGGSC